MPPSRAAIALLLVSLLAGCLGGDDAAAPAAAPEPEPPATATAVAPGAPNSTSPATPGQPIEVVLHATAEGALEREAPPPGSVTMAGSYAKCFGAGTCGSLSFVTTPVDEPVRIEPGVVTTKLWIQADAPVLQGPFDFGVWIGSTRTMPLAAIRSAPGPILPGEPTLIEIPIDFSGAMPVVLLPGDSLRLMVVSGMLHEETGVMKLLTGGGTASSVTLSLRATVLPEPGPVASETFSGAIDAPSVLVAETGRNQATHAFVVGPDATRVEIALRLTGSARGEAGDVDMDVLLGDRVLAGGHTPYGVETVLLAGEEVAALRGQELTVRVANFLAPKATYEIDVAQS